MSLNSFTSCWDQRHWDLVWPWLSWVMIKSVNKLNADIGLVMHLLQTYKISQLFGSCLQTRNRALNIKALTKHQVSWLLAVLFAYIKNYM